MRALTLVFADIRFQYKYGFYLLYFLFSLLYIGVLFALPEAWRADAALIMIYTDPAAMGLFFMGAIVLFEKSERVLDSVAVSPVKPWEYVAGKLVSIGLVSTIVALIIGFPAGVVAHPARFVVGIFLCSCMFSAIALLIACRATTLNQFILATVPTEILIITPAVIWLFLETGRAAILHPGVAALMFCMPEGGYGLALFILLAWTALFTWLAMRAVKKMLRSLGGVKL